VREVALSKLFSIDVVVDVDGLFPHVSTQLLDELAGHPGPPEVGGEPVAAIVKREVVFHPVRVGIM